VIVREAENKKRLHAGLPEKEGFFYGTTSGMTAFFREKPMPFKTRGYPQRIKARFRMSGNRHRIIPAELLFFRLNYCSS